MGYHKSFVQFGIGDDQLTWEGLFRGVVYGSIAVSLL